MEKDEVIVDESSAKLVSEPEFELPSKPLSDEVTDDNSDYVVVEKTPSNESAKQTEETEVDNLPNDIEALKILVRDLRKQVASLEQEIATLKSKKTAALAPVTGAKLSPLTKGRVMKPGVVSKMKSTTSSEGSQHESDDTPTSVSSAAADESVPEIDPEVAEEQRKKRLIAQMGGVNPLAGINPAAFLKSRSSLGHGSNHEEGSSSPTNRSTTNATQEVNEDSIRSWISKKIGTDIQGEWKDVLRDGTVLCKLINTLRPDNPVKVNTGRFSFMHMENINNYLKASASMGVAKQMTFSAADLYDGTDINKVLQNLSALQKVTEN